jgi:hypothetical protein
MKKHHARNCASPAEMLCVVNLVRSNCCTFNKPHRAIFLAVIELEAAWKQLCSIQESTQLKASMPAVTGPTKSA